MESDGDTGFDSSLSEEDSISEKVDKTQVTKTGVKRKQKSSESKVKKKSKKDMCKPPTVNELNELRETENLFHSNLFRLQIEEMLKEIKLKEKHKRKFENWFENFKIKLMNMKNDKESRLLTDQTWLKKMKIKLPVLQEPFQVKGNYKFVKPADIKIFGSYKLDISLCCKSTVNVQVVIPPEFYFDGDNLNTKYHRKRAFYLCQVGNFLKSCTDDIVEVNIVLIDDNIYKPVLEIVPVNLEKHFLVHLHFVPSKSPFKLNRFNPSKNNVRSSWFFNDSSVIESSPTPHYNSSVVNDLVMDTNYKHLTEVFTKYNNLKDGVLLFKVWLKQRDLNIGYGCFNDFIICMLAVYLIGQRKLNIHMSSYQIVRNLWSFIGQSDWTKSGPNLNHSEADDHDKPSLDEFHRYFDVVFVDVTGYWNICSNMSVFTYETVKFESQQAIRYLDNSTLNSFKLLFMTHLPFHQVCDHVISFHDTESLELLTELKSTRADKLDYMNDTYSQAVKLICNLLKKALGNRVQQIRVKQQQCSRGGHLEKRPKQNKTIVVGLIVDPECGHSVVTKGPEADLDEANEFREFWGEKSELRRFQDGSITEAVVWSGKCLSERRTVCKQIVEYVLKLKFNLLSASYVYLCDQLEFVVKRNVYMNNFQYGTGEEVTVDILDSFDKLSRSLRSLEDLPLGIISLQGSSPVFRYTEVFPPLPAVQTLKKGDWTSEKSRKVLVPDTNINMPSYLPSMNVIVQLVTSKKWPYNTDAIKRVKAAFCIRIAELMTKRYKLTTEAFQDSVEIYQDGFIFKLIIYYPNEIGLLKRLVGADGSVKYRDTEESVNMEYELVHKPLLTSTLHGLHQQYPAYGPACCIAKRWISSQMFDSSHVSEETIELVMSSLFLTPEPYHTTTQPQSAFFRFLQLLATTDWNSEPLVLNFNDELAREDILEIEKHFNTNRVSLPSMFIATPNLRHNSMWTKNSPTPVVLLRLVQLAEQALQLVHKHIYDKSLHHLQTLFVTSTAPFDVLIHINQWMNVKHHQNISRISNFVEQLERYEKPDNELFPVVDFDPVSCYLNDLRSNYEEHCLFFHDSYGGDVIGVLWKPHCLETKEFKVSHVMARKVNQHNMLEFNLEAVLEDFYHMGKGLIKKIEVKIDEQFQSINLFH